MIAPIRQIIIAQIVLGCTTGISYGEKQGNTISLPELFLFLVKLKHFTGADICMTITRIQIDLFGVNVLIAHALHLTAQTVWR